MKTKINTISIKVLTALTILMFFAVSVKAQINYGTNSVTGANASAIGDHNTAAGTASFVGGIDSEALGKYSIALGDSAKAWSRNGIALGKQVSVFGAYSFGVGENVKTNGTSAMVMGIGYNDQNPLINGESRSLMVGFNSDRPTFFIGMSTGLGHTGKIGIGDVTDPKAKLHVKADAGENADLMLEPGGSGNYAIVKFGETLPNVSPNRITAKPSGDLDFYSGSDFVFNNANVGIGTTSPDEKLEVDGTVKSTGLLLNDGTQAIGKVLQSDANGLASWADPMTLAVDDGDWAMNGNDMHNMNTGNVGIGTGASAINYKLEVNGSLFAKEFRLDGSLPAGDPMTGFDGFILQSDQYGNASWADPMTLAVDDGDWEIIGNNIWRPTGNVGIGKNNPQAALDVAGNIKASSIEVADHLYVNSTVYGNSSGGSSKLTIYGRDNSNSGKIEIWNGTAGSDIKLVARANGNIQFFTDSHWRMSINDDFVEMGNPSLAVGLKVHGKIDAEEIEVHALGWSDFVFGKGYHLKKLSEVEDFIAKNGHLPEIPSEADVLENGYNMGEMDALLLKKIEELTLYVIEQQKVINELKKKQQIKTK